MNYEPRRTNKLALLFLGGAIAMSVYNYYKPTTTHTQTQLSRRAYHNNHLQYIIRSGDTMECFRRSEGVTVNLKNQYYELVQKMNDGARSVRVRDSLYVNDALTLPDINNNKRVGCDETTPVHQVSTDTLDE